MKDLINRLLKGEGKISLMLLEARAYVEESEDVSLLAFIDNEINGYTEAEIPSYRKIKGEIVGDIKDPYGSIQRNVPLGLSALSEQVGADLTIAHVFDNIGFIEENLQHLSGEFVNRPLVDELVHMLNNVIQYNNPGITLTSASHSFSRSTLQHIPSKVREELIKGLQRLNKSEKKPLDTDKKNIEHNVGAPKINVFVSYAWDGEDHNDKVISFVDFLRKQGYNASMDRMKSQDESAINFNRMMITSLDSADKVIIVLSKKYKEKADSFEGGVGVEFQIILEEIKTKLNKYIFVSFGANLIGEITPTGIKGREVLDLKEDQENEFNNLFAKLLSKNTINFSDVADKVSEIKQKNIKPFRL